MNNLPEDQRWLDVLAGQREADDADTRSAAQWRQHFQQRAAREMAPNPGADARREQRLLEALEKRGLLGAAVQEQPHARPDRRDKGKRPRGLLGALTKWLSSGPAMAALSPRWALAAVLALAVGVAPLLMREPPAGDEGMKASVPAGTAGETLMMVADPTADAARLAAQLSELGLQVSMQPQGRDQVVRVDVPPGTRDAAQSALMAEGIVIPPDGRLVVRIRPVP